MEGYFLPPREDINSPDMYIPGMPLVIRYVRRIDCADVE